MSAEDRIFWMAARQALLMLLDALERRLEIRPYTSELRREAKREKLLHARSGDDTVVATQN